jgi:hypothetical protein
MVVFALERANPDVLLFLVALATGILAECCLSMRVIGYFVALLAALLKYYPIMILVIVFRETRSIFVVLTLLILGCLSLFWAKYHADIIRGLPSIAHGPYNTDLFAGKNLPFLLGEAAGSAAEPSSWASAVQWMVSAGIYAILLGGSLRICGKLLGVRELRDALGALAGRERLFLVIGSAVIAGCFFAGQSTGYRGVIFLLTIPGLLALSRTPCHGIRKLSLGTAVVIVLVMWSECFRHGLDLFLDTLSVSQMLVGYLKILFWLFRELAWWWIISVMLAVLVDFVSASPIGRGLSTRFSRPLADAA